MREVVEQIVNALSLGSIYALVALGLAILFSIMGLVNFAHSEIITLAGFAMYALVVFGIPFPFLLAPLSAILVGALVAYLMERIAFRPVRNSSETTMMLTSFGLSIIILSLLQTLISTRVRALPPPDWLGRSVRVLSAQFSLLNIATILMTATALLVLTLVLRRTTLGRAMRAAAEDFDATRLMGIKADSVILAAFLISGVLAALACISIVGRRATVDSMMGQSVLLMSFVATVIGGFGRLGGAVVGGFLLGGIEVALRATLPPSMTGLTQGFVFVVVAIVISIRPNGLFGAASASRV